MVIGMGTRLNCAFGQMSRDWSTHLSCITKELYQKEKMAQTNKYNKVRQNPKRWRYNTPQDCRDVLEVWFNVHWIKRVAKLTRNDVQNGVLTRRPPPPSSLLPSCHHFPVFPSVCPTSNTFISLLTSRGKMITMSVFISRGILTPWCPLSAVSLSFWKIWPISA